MLAPMESVRIRLVFEEHHLLNKSLRKHGLKRSWILLKPHFNTVSDFSSYLLDSFLLRDSSPHGLILSMDGFVLPPFESTSVLKDNDIVRVKKKENVTLADKIDNGPYPSVKEFNDCKKEANEDEPCDSLQLEPEDTLQGKSDKKTVCRKRKAQKQLLCSKLKKNSSASTARCLLAPQDLQQTHPQHNQSFQQDVILSEKRLVKKHKSFGSKKNKDKSRLMEEQVKAHKKKVQQQIVESSNHKLPDKNYFKDSELVAGSCDDDETVPVVIRPGHIRFEPLGQVENWSVHPAQTSKETLRWNGIISKKKEQKWGKKKSLSWGSNCKNYLGASSTLQITKDLSTVDFNKLRPCASMPKKGDIIAYRLIELSSTWTPELSSFRVGKVSWFKPEANKITLIPVPEYPFVYKKVMNGESTSQVNTSPYEEDGWLKADYSSLVDIRIVKHGNSKSFVATADRVGKVSHTNQRWNKWASRASKRENGSKNAWDEILEAMSGKKTELSEEVGWSRV